METEAGPGAPPAGKPPRRPRYAGTHPRRFHEKYKERAPDAYPEDVAKVVASGKTPAGSHRPACVAEILDVLAPRAGEVAVDATLGHGGHALALLARLRPGGRLIGIDTDPAELARTEQRIRAAGYGPDQFVAVATNYAGVPRVLTDLGLGGADMVLADLGCSSMQLDDPERGFSYKHDGPLDMRMNPRKGRPASALLATVREADLARVLADFGDEPHADVVARRIVALRGEAPLERTSDLARIVHEAVPRHARHDATLARVFQALRIAVNDEMSALETFLRVLPSCLRPGGRVAILTFHSGEDRRVKHAFQEGRRAGLYEQVARDVIRAGRAEVRSNPRASSAKLRWAVRSEEA